MKPKKVFFDFLQEEKMKEVKIYEEDIQEAYKNGCEDVQKTLKQLYPGLKLGWSKGGEFYKAEELMAHVSSNSQGLYLVIVTPEGTNLVSSWNCEDKDDLIWVSFHKCDGIELSDKHNFRIRKRT